MAVVEAKIKKWGNSIGLIIPRDIVKIENLHIGDTVKVEIGKEKRVDAFGIFKGGPSFKREEDDRGEFW
jgi:hypothetical protein|tara:strand:- start:427 stop:633 length:207 start_codon:yes stop_codon:yes gene_type:complete